MSERSVRGTRFDEVEAQLRRRRHHFDAAVAGAAVGTTETGRASLAHLVIDIVHIGRLVSSRLGRSRSSVVKVHTVVFAKPPPPGRRSRRRSGERWTVIEHDPRRSRAAKCSAVRPSLGDDLRAASTARLSSFVSRHSAHGARVGGCFAPLLPRRERRVRRRSVVLDVPADDLLCAAIAFGGCKRCAECPRRDGRGRRVDECRRSVCRPREKTRITARLQLHRAGTRRSTRTRPSRAIPSAGRPSIAAERPTPMLPTPRRTPAIDLGRARCAPRQPDPIPRRDPDPDPRRRGCTRSAPGGPRLGRVRSAARAASSSPRAAPAAPISARARERARRGG